MASRLTSAAQGASTGATVGSTLGPYGTLAGAGIGAIAGGIAGGPSEAQLLEEKRMAELMRRQELGTLGLTEQEMQVAMGQAQGAISQQQQAQNAQQAGLMASQDLGAGAVFRAQQEEDSLKRREMEGARQKVVQRDIIEKRLQEQELTTLAGLAEKRQELEREAMVTALTDVSGQAIGAGTDIFKLTEAKKKEAAMETKEFDAWDKKFDTAFGGQGQASVGAQMDMYDNVQPQFASAPLGMTGFGGSPGLSERLATQQFNTLGMGGNFSYGENPLDFQALMREQKRKRLLASLGEL
jgi:hypothetical protein